MKRMTFILATLFGLGSMSGTVAQDAKNIIPGVSINHFEMERNGKYLSVEMGMDLTELDVETNRAVLLTPRLVNGADSTDLPSIGSISGTDETTLRASKMPKNMDYNNSVVYEEWMDGATLKFHRSDWGCCHEILAEYESKLGRHNEAFFPELVFIHPKAEIEKSRSLSGSAFIDFPVDQTVIYPEYRRNTAELGKIEGICLSRKSLQTQYGTCHRAYCRTQEAHQPVISLCGQHHPDRLRTRRLGRAAPLRREVQPRPPQGDTRND